MDGFLLGVDDGEGVDRCVSEGVAVGLPPRQSEGGDVTLTGDCRRHNVFAKEGKGGELQIRVRRVFSVEWN
eukprot:2504515-Rhodomonas_salina.1